MNKKILIGSIIAVAIIVLSSFSSVVGKVSSDEELVEFDVEFSGLGKKHTVSLTQQEAVEVELLFDDIEQRLSEVETREETEEIFKDAVVELDKYGLLGGLSIKQAQRLVTGYYQKFIPSKLQQKISERYSNPKSGYINRFCLTYFTSDIWAEHTLIFKLTFWINFAIWTVAYAMGPILYIYSEAWWNYNSIRPVHILSTIEPYNGTYLYSIGLLGIQTLTNYTDFDFMVRFFCGLRITTRAWLDEDYYLMSEAYYFGFAESVIDI